MIRLRAVGYGKRAHAFIAHALRPEAWDGVRVVAVLDPDERGARARLDPEDREASFFDTVDAMMRQARPDAVLVGTRCNLHADYAEQLAAYDVPLFLEKPVAISYDQAYRLEDAFLGAGPPALVSFPLRMSPLYRLAKRSVAAGAVGEPLHIMASAYITYGSVYWESEYRNFEITGGLWLQKATHEFDYMSKLMGSPIVAVRAMGLYAGVFGGNKPAELHCAVCDERDECMESPENRRRNGSGGTLSDHRCVFSVAAGTRETGTNHEAGSALLEFGSGAHGVYTQVFFSRRDAARRGGIVSGYHGTVDFDWYRNDLVEVAHHEPFTRRTTGGEPKSHFGGDAALARNFVGMVERGAEPECSIADGLESVYACLAAQESERSGKRERVRQVGSSG